MECTVNQAVKLPFVSSGLSISVNPGTGEISFTYIALVNGVRKTISDLTFTRVSSSADLYLMNFIPDVVGEWDIYIEGAIQIKFTVVTKTMAAVIDDLKDEALGSWIWNKVTGVLTLYKASGVVMSTYNVLDTPDSASRERLS